MIIFSLSGTGYKPTPQPGVQWVPTHTPPAATPSPISGGISGAIGQGGMVYNAGAQYTHNLPNGSVYGSAGHAGSTFNNKG